MKKIFNIFRRSVLSPSSSSSSPPRRDSGVPPFGPDSYIIRVKDLGKIHKAAALGDVKKVQELLLHEKAGVDDLDKKHRTPLHLACANGYPDVVSLLVERKCELNPLDDEDQTPLMNAVQYQQEECTTILLEHGADSCAMNTYQSTALHYAACLHNIKIASKLLRYNVSMEAKNKDGCTPLLLAVMKNNPDMVDLFLKNGANVNTSDVRDRTPLMIAARSNRLHVVSLLLQYDIDFSHKDAYGRTAVDYAFYGSPLMHRLVVDEYKKQKALNQPLSPQICGSERASDTEFTLGGPDKDQEDSIEELDLGAEDVIDVTKNQPGSKVFETFPFEEDEAFGFGSDSETGFSIVIPGEKPVPRKQFEVQIPIVKEQDEEGPSDWNSSSASLKTESARKSKNFNIYGNHPWQSVSVTRIPCGPTPKIRKISTLEDEAVGAGSGTETEFEDAIRGQKSVPQKQAEPQFPVKPLKGPSDWDSSSASLKTESSGKSKDSKCGQNHPWQSVSVTRIPCGRTPKTRKISTLEDEAVGAGRGPETESEDAIRGQKSVPQKQAEPQIPVKPLKGKKGPSDWDSSSASLKTESSGKSKDSKCGQNHPWQSVSVTRIPCGRTPKTRKISTLEDEAVGAGRGPETESEDAIRGQKSVPQKQAEPQIPVKPLKGPSDWDSSSASLKTESSGKSKDSKCGQNHPWQSVSVTRIPCGRTPKTRKISTLEDEAVGAGRGPETESEDAIRGQKSVPQKQAEPQIPVKPLKGKKDSLQRYLNLKPIPATTKISYSFSNQDLGKGIQEKQKSYSIKELGFNETDETNGPSDRDSCSTSLKTESYRKCRDLNLDENHPCQLLPETKIRCGSTLFGNIPFQEDETVGAGNDSETELRLVVRGEKSVAQKEDEPHLSVKKLKVNEGPSDWDSCSTSLKTESYRKSTDLNFDENHPCQSLPATKIHSGSPVLGKITFKEEQALGAGSRPETEFRVVIRGEKSVTQKREEKEGNDEACRGSSEECPESLDKSDLEEDKAQMESNDRDDQIQASGTATEDYDLLPLNYPMRHLRTEIVVLRYDRTVERKKTHCTLLTRKVKSLQNKINGLREKLSEARQMKSHLEHQKAEWNRELLRIRCTLKQEEMEQVTTEMLFEESRQLFRRKKERYSKAVALNQQLECTFRSQEAELRTIRNHLQQVEEELNDTQRQLVQVQRARALQDTILKNLLWKQKEKEAVASKATQTSEVPENNEKEKTLLDKNQILLDEVFVLKLDLHRVKMELQQKENQFTEDTDVLKETIDELHKKLQLKEEALTKITSQYRGQLNVLTTENEVLNSKLEKAKRSRDRLETEIASYHARLTSALHDHERSQISNPDLEQTVQRERDELRRLHDELIHHLGSLSETNGVLSQRLWKAEGKTNRLQRELNCVRDSLREKTLTLETTQRELNRAQHKANELQHLNQVEKEKMDKCIFQHESVQKRLTQIESENMLLQQQLEDAQNKNIVKEKVLSDSHGQFMDRFHCVRADTGKQALMREDRNGELTGEYNYLREKIPKYEKEKAKIKTTVRRQQELADFLIEQSVTETSLEVKSFARNDFEVKKKLPKERDEAKSKLCTERDNLKKRSELNQSLVNCLERELKRNEELQKELRGYKSLYITTNNKLREYEAIFSSLSSSSTLSSSSSSSPSSSSSSSS
ncbi:uncharacterized protein [Notamacropus eugenii]|uniref:uncharacterized protein isoform X2 n=1 Tax=Notamacropus eugenii TaxID=9315 RepID=UPI003B66C1D4